MLNKLLRPLPTQSVNQIVAAVTDHLLNKNPLQVVEVRGATTEKSMALPSL